MSVAKGRNASLGAPFVLALFPLPLPLPAQDGRPRDREDTHRIYNPVPVPATLVPAHTNP